MIYSRISLVILIATSAMVSLNRAHAEPDGVPSGHRVALLVENSEYPGVTLYAASRSLALVESSLKDAGFEVQRAENLDQKRMTETIDGFLRSTPTNGVVLIYYFGLARTSERNRVLEPMLRPVDVTIDKESDYRNRSYGLSSLKTVIERESSSKHYVVCLDADHDSPIAPKGTTLKPGVAVSPDWAASTVLHPRSTETAGRLPTSKEPTTFAKAVSEAIPVLDKSTKEFCLAVQKQQESVRYAGVTDNRIGPAASSSIHRELQDGGQAGDVYLNSIGMCFRWCPEGEFRIGSQETDLPQTEDRSVANVRLTSGYWMGEYEVTQQEYSRVMRKNLGRDFTLGPSCPFWGAGEVKAVKDFCTKLTEIEQKAGTLPNGWEYDCPTEAEWEYACRAGSTSRWCFGDDVGRLGAYGNVADRALNEENPNYHYADVRVNDGVGERLAAVGSFRPNAWGLRDMHGNVAELVADHLTSEPRGGTDPLVQVEKNGKCQIRGGAWCSLPLYTESSFRNSIVARAKSNYVGFRIVLKRKR